MADGAQPAQSSNLRHRRVVDGAELLADRGPSAAMRARRDLPHRQSLDALEPPNLLDLGGGVRRRRGVDLRVAVRAGTNVKSNHFRVLIGVLLVSSLPRLASASGHG